MTKMRYTETLPATLLPLVIWAGHLVLVYAVVSLACARNLATITASVLVVLFTLAAVGAVTLLIKIFRQRLRQANERDSNNGKRFERPGSQSFISKAGLLIGILSLIAILWTALPFLFLAPCE